MDNESDHSEDTPWKDPNHFERSNSNGSNLQDEYQQNMPVQVHGRQENVLLYNTNSEEVARGLTQALEAGNVLEGLVISPSEEAILIVQVFAPYQQVYEILLFNMGDCLNKVIRWPRNLLRRVPCATEC
jgi:hypothetical protein